MSPGLLVWQCVRAGMRKPRMNIQVVPVAVALKILAEELKQKESKMPVRRSKSKLEKPVKE